MFQNKTLLGAILGVLVIFAILIGSFAHAPHSGGRWRHRCPYRRAL